MHVQLIYVSLKPEAIKILKLCVLLIVIFLLGLFHLDFNQVLRHEKGVLTHFVDIYHLFTSTEKMHGMFQFHIFSLTW